MGDYSLHAVATRPAQVGETLVSTTFRGTSTRGFASESAPAVAVCMLPGTELAFAENVRYDNRWIWTKSVNFRVGKFGEIDPDVPHRHHDAIEFPDGSHVLVTQLDAFEMRTREGPFKAGMTPRIPVPPPESVADFTGKKMIGR